MTQIKSENAKSYIDEKGYTMYGEPIICLTSATQAVLIAETEAEERHANELQALKDKTVALAGTARGAMILDGYELEDSCVKYMNELIGELQKLNENQ